MVFVAAWMFLLGVIVGRGTAPVRIDIDKLQKELAGLKEAVLKKEKLKFSTDPNIPKETDLDFYEKLKDSNQNAPNAERRLTAPPKKVEKKSPTKPETSQPNEKTKAPARGEKIVLQVASLKDPKIADEMVARLKAKGFSAFRATAELSGKGTWYRVRIAGFQTQKQVETAIQRLKKEGFSVMVVKQ